MDDGPVLLYDGLCRFCDRTVRVLLRLDRRRVFRFAPLDGQFARQTMERHPDLRDVDSLLLVEAAAGQEQTYVRSGALLRITKHLGLPWRLLRIFTLVPRPLRDRAYDVFARHRYRLFGRLEECPIPPPEVRSRFLD